MRKVRCAYVHVDVVTICVDRATIYAGVASQRLLAEVMDTECRPLLVAVVVLEVGATVLECLDRLVFARALSPLHCRLRAEIVRTLPGAVPQHHRALPEAEIRRQRAAQLPRARARLRPSLPVSSLSP